MFIKQVPDTNDVKWTQNNNIDRTKMDSIINPVDKQAIEVALRLKEAYSANITAITMGPGKAIEVLKEAIALGVDDAVILCDSKFSGSDTCATSRVLAAAVKEKFPDTDLILFGQSAIDGETSQTGPSTAVRLGYPFVCHVNEIVEFNNDKITINTETETYKEVLEIQMPAVLCISNYVFKPRIPKINGYIKSQDYYSESNTAGNSGKCYYNPSINVASGDKITIRVNAGVTSSPNVVTINGIEYSSDMGTYQNMASGDTPGAGFSARCQPGVYGAGAEKKPLSTYRYLTGVSGYIAIEY